MKRNSHTRRRSYVPKWVTTENIYINGVFAGHRKLEGKELAKQLRWWHEDKSNWFHPVPHKDFRRETHAQLRAFMKHQLRQMDVDDGCLEPICNIRRFVNPPFFD